MPNPKDREEGGAVNRDTKKLIQTTVIYLLTLQIMMSAGSVSLAAVQTMDSDRGRSIISSHASDVLKIISVLEERVADQLLLEKAKGKVFTLGDQHTRLIASLADQAVKERNSSSGDIAFLLIAALIILL